ncbi:acyl-CoA carboxylase subunit epsilon [Streptomyces pristinaespiralis]|jgi:hypothetical protein|uniref:Uncharacterized protein snbW n=1 Tax=Streptomyces pristinaespiralis TaxID=38300 RepID=D9UBW6_STRPR|nr:acyl-CoA carboxylase subunit epsilon [Streptomyces pristinaespiralis]ALC18621.1 hypothetical protein SPRI_0315 [Streptomyces pristinaespiralis]ALC25344.1 hypothetical protein SPRI_7038 [Streptomyces pristinaespiralis]QMU12433.1 acyl-CoA carboxylase subunit epsilon [Streptomyces pristinaespiralis]CBW45763.1 hypothetical protein [Streptomyces pristinaespiralis]
MTPAHDDTATLLRVERGVASTEELAAVTATLFSLLATRRTPQEPDTTHTRAYWRRQAAGAFRAPHSWR